MNPPSQSGLQAEAEARLLFEMLLADVCAQFVNVAPNDIDSKIASAQRAICESLKVDHSSVWQVSEENPDMPVMTHVYRDPNLKPLPLHPNVKEYFPWSSNKILNKEMVCVPNTATLPPEAATDKGSWEDYGIHSSLVIPLTVGGGSVIGVLAFSSERERDWPEPLRRRLQILAHVFAQAFDRKNADRKLRESEVRRKRHEDKLREYERAIESAEEMIAVVDREYRILIANHQFLKVRNMTREQVAGRFAREVLNEGVFEAVVKPKLDECFQGKVVRYETKYTYPKLGERDLLVSYFPIEGVNGIERAVSISQDITERKRAEEAVKESETRFRLVADTAPVMIWMSGLDKKPTYFNQPWLDFTGLSETDLQNGLAEIVHPDDYQQCHEVYCRGFDQRQPFRKECRLRRHDGQYRWMLDIGVPRFHKDGSFAGYIGSCIDVTEHKVAQEAMSDMTRKLVEAQEHERARIARELHDDINQRLAMLAVELEQLQDDPSQVRSRVQELRKQTTEISNGVQALSHDLHSSQLDYLGAVAGMKSWCKEFAERQGMQIDYRHDVQSTLPREIGLCLFRVLQEALQNAAKHSGVKRIEVQLREKSGEIHLIIRDLGKGFDVETAKQGRGLGLTSMRERVRLVNGTIDIQSKPMSGTTIHVRVPLDSERGSQRLAV